MDFLGISGVGFSVFTKSDDYNKNGGKILLSKFVYDNISWIKAQSPSVPK